VQQRLWIGHRQGEVRNPQLIQLQRRASDLLTHVTGQGEGGLQSGPETQADAAAALAGLLIIMQSPAFRRIRHGICEHLRA